jgi:hypothetical protein
MTRRPDQPAILGLIGLAGLIVLGWIVLSALDKPVPAEAWLAVGALGGIVGGWVGKTVVTEVRGAIDSAPPATPPDIAGAGAPTPPAAAGPATWSRTTTGPVGQD